MLCEFGVDKLRFYYEVSQGIIWINSVGYFGEVKIIKGAKNHKSGNKQNNPNQRRDILKLIKNFKTNSIKIKIHFSRFFYPKIRLSLFSMVCFTNILLNIYD